MASSLLSSSMRSNWSRVVPVLAPPVPVLDRAGPVVENMTAPPDEGGISPVAIAAAVVGLGLAGLVVVKMRKKKRRR